MTDREVTAVNYCDFLNKNAVEDPGHLYNKKIETDPETACIVRLGTPGKYSYQVIAGRENFPVMYVTKLNQESYDTETGFSLAEDNDFNAQNSLTPSVGCSRIGFMVAMQSNASLLTMFEPLDVSAGSTAGEIGIELALLLGGGIAGDRMPSFSVLSERAEMSHNDMVSLNLRSDALNERIRKQSVITKTDYNLLSEATQKNQEAALKALDANRAALQKAREPHDLIRLGNNSQTAQTAAATWAQRAEWITFEKTVLSAVAVYRRTIAAPSEAAWDQFGIACKETLQVLTSADHAQRNLLTHPIPEAERSSIIDQISWAEGQKLDWATKIQFAEDQKAKIIFEAARASEIAKNKLATAQRRAAKKAAKMEEEKRHHDELIQQQALEQAAAENKKNRLAQIAREEARLALVLVNKENDQAGEKTAISDSSLTRSSRAWSSVTTHFFSLSDDTKKTIYDTSVFLAQTTFNVTKKIVGQVWDYIPNPITKFQIYSTRRKAQRLSNTFTERWNAALKCTDPNNPNFKTRWQLAIASAEQAHKAWLKPEIGLNDDLVIYTQKNHELLTDLVKTQHAGLLAKNDSAHLLSMPQNPSLQKEKDERAAMKKIATTSQKEADGLWKELSEKAKTLDADIPTSQRTKWNETITIIRNQQSLHILLPLREHADKLVELFTEKGKQISALDIDDTKLHEKLTELATITQSIATAWERIIDACLQFENRNISTEKITTARETALYEKAYTLLEELRIRARQEDKIAEAASHSLKNSENEKTDASMLKALQNDVVVKKQKSRQAWLNFITCHQELNGTIPEQHKNVWRYNFGTIFEQAQQAEEAFLREKAAL